MAHIKIQVITLFCCFEKKLKMSRSRSVQEGKGFTIYFVHEML